MSEENDNLDAPMEQAFQHGMTIAAQVGTELSQAWQKHRERQAKADGAQAALMQAQFNAERTTALEALRATTNPQWWETANMTEVAKAFEISTAWKDYAPEAAIADQHIRQEVAARYGIDVEQLAQNVQATTAAAPVLTEKEQLNKDLQKAKAYFDQADPERLRAYRREVDYSDSALDNIPYHKALVKDWRTATGQDVPAVQSQAEENDRRAKEAQAEALLERAEAATADREVREEHAVTRDAGPEVDGPNAADEAWFAEQMTQPQNHEQAADFQGHEQAANTAERKAGAKWDSAERREALAHELRTKAVPDEAITARLHAERQHARPISASVNATAETAKKTKVGTGQSQANTLKKHL